MEPTGRELLMEDKEKRDGKSKEGGTAEIDTTQASWRLGAEALENKFGNIIPQDLH